MTANTLNQLYTETLRDVYYAEKKILDALPKMSEKVGSDQLRAAFEEHRKETETHVERLEKIFDMLGEKASGKKCDAIEGLTDEAEQMMREVEDKKVLDAALVAGAQAVEHYEMARYGTLREWASLLGHNDAVGLIEETLEEEKAADAKLNKLAMDGVNEAAARAA